MCTPAALWAEEKETYTLDALSIGADAMGRGGAYLTDADSSPVFQNFALATAPRFSFSSFKLLSELNYLSAAYAQNGLSLGFLTMQDSAGYQRDENNNLLGGRINYSDSTIYAAYGFALDKLHLGLRLKYQTRSLAETAAAQGYSLDFASSYSLNSFWSFGLALFNISNTALLWTDGREEKFPVRGALGGRYSVFGAEQVLNFYTDARFEDNDVFFSLGTEWRPVSLLTLRGGFSQANVWVWQSDREIKQFTPAAGLGLNLWGLSFDYAYSPDADLAENLTHFFTLGYTFNTGSSSGETEKLSTAEKDASAAAVTGRRRIYKDIYHLPLEEQYLIEDLGYLGISQLDDTPPSAPDETAAEDK
jgi:hypothetical protein